jgi:hypothetical protein
MAAQQAGIDGQNNIIVQIEGSNNAVNLKGLAHLTLTRYLTRRHIETDVDLLSPYTRSIPLIGRERELGELHAWLTNEKPISIRVLTGRAGSGKTRLALELCEQMLAEGWDAGFLESGELGRFRASQNLATWGWQHPTLIVSDYAAEHAERLHGWFQELADNQGDPEKPLRILLLERHAETGSGWLQTAFGRGGFGAQALQRLLDPAEPVPLLPIATSNERRSVMGNMLQAAGTDQRPPEEGADPAFDRKLAELTWGGEPLFLMMAGLMVKDIGMAHVLSLGRTDLAFELAQRELARIARIGAAKGVDADFMEVMAAYVTLCRGLEATQIRAAVPAEQAALGVPRAGDPGTVAKLLHEALPGAVGANPILPDMIGEAAILRALPRHYDDSSAAVVRAFGQTGGRVAATVIRIAQDFAEAGYLKPLEWLDALAEHGSVHAGPLMMIVDALPSSSIALAEHGARISATLARVLRAEVEAGAEHRLPHLAAALTNLSMRLSAVGQRQEALASGQEAVDLYRALADKAPDAYRPALAMALNNLASSLSAVGQREAALAAAQEAADLYRALAATEPNAFRPELALALNNLANGLSAVGQRQEALAPAQEAVDIYRELAERAPDSYRPRLAMALNNLANRLSGVGQRQEALAPAQEAVAIRRELAAKAPDAYRPDLASALNNLANRLSGIGQPQEALAPAQEAADLYRALVAKAPDAFRPALAAILSNLAVRLSEVGQHQEALTPSQEAANLYRALAADAPDEYRPDLAKALNNLAIRLSEVGQRQEALTRAQEAVDLYRVLAAKATGAFWPDLASVLNTLALRLSEVGRPQDALAPAQEAADLYRALAQKAPDAYRPGLARALNNLANRSGAVGQPQEALQVAQQAADLYRELAAEAPDEFRPDLAMALTNLAVRWGAAGQHQDALAPAQEAADLYCALAERAPDAYRANLAGSLTIVAKCLDANGDLASALEQNQKAIEIYRPYFLAQPPAFAHRMMLVCRQYIESCKKLGREPDANLLTPILEVLRRMQGASGGEEGSC